MRLICCFLLFTGLLSGCKTSKTNHQQKAVIASVTYGTHFGHCRGICRKELHLSDGKTWTVQAGNDLKTNPEEKQELPFDKKSWNQLTVSIDWNTFNKLQEVIGCPDCADGGTEYITITTGTEKKTVKFEYGSQQEMMEPYLNQLRELFKENVH